MAKTPTVTKIPREFEKLNDDSNVAVMELDGGCIFRDMTPDGRMALLWIPGVSYDDFFESMIHGKARDEE